LYPGRKIVVAQSNADDNYQAKGVVTCKLVWAKQVFWEFKFGSVDKLKM